MLIELGRRGERKEETGVVEIDKPTLLNEVLDAYIHGLNYSINELSTRLNLYDDDFTFLFLPKEQARIRVMKTVVFN